MIQSKSYELIEAQDSQPSLVMMKSTELILADNIIILEALEEVWLADQLIVSRQRVKNII